MRLRLLVSLAALAAGCVPPSTASAASTLDTVLRAPAAQVRTCHERAVTGADSVAATTYTAPASGLLTVRTAGGGDYDVAALGTRGRYVAAAAGPTSDELAQGFVVKGERLRLQVCHFSGPPSPVHVEASTMAIHPRRS